MKVIKHEQGGNYKLTMKIKNTIGIYLDGRIYYFFNIYMVLFS